MTDVAQRIAERIPLAHFPARNSFLGESGWPEWPAQAVLPTSLRPGKQEPEDPHERVRWAHAFLFAGPACFAASGQPAGDGVLYFGPSVDSALDGAACPFDTGSCRPRPRGGFLEPYASQDADACMARIDESSVPIRGWRDELRGWLDHCYRAPDRYLETSGDRYTDGRPDSTRPPDLLQQNGRKGSADRRAWTWEVRTKQPVGFEHLAAVHVASHALDADMLDRRDDLEGRFKVRIRLFPLRAGLPHSPKYLYQDSERVVRNLVAGGRL